MPSFFNAYRIFFSLAFILFVAQSHGQWSEEQKVLAGVDARAFDYFAAAVAISDNIAIVGAYGDDDNGLTSGSAYVFERSGGTWSQVAKLLPTDGNAEDRFGYSVAISGSYAIVGAYLDDDNGEDSGSAYVFENIGGTWIQVAKLLPQDGVAGDAFGLSVSISGNKALVGSLWDDDNGIDSGSAYVFERTADTWNQLAKLKPVDGSAEDRFGTSVSLSGNTALISAYYDDFNGSYSGSAYVFEFSDGLWNQQAKILPSDGAFGDNFGFKLALSESTAIVGAFRDSDNGYESGSAYIFERSGGAWDQETKLLPSDGAPDHRFGWSVSISGSVAVVGSYKDNDNGIHSGSVYAFTKSNGTWDQTEKLIASDGADYDWFGYDVSISNGTIIVGAPIDDDVDIDTGSAFFFSDSICDPPSLTATVVDESCLASSDGTITVMSSGGTGSFSYSLDGSLGQESNNFTDLMGAGTEYTVTVIVDEDEECTSSINVTVSTTPDTIPPSIECEEDILLINDPEMCGAIVSFNTFATDNCPLSVDVVCSPESHSFFPVGTTTVTCIATDDAGNSSSCSFDVTIFDDDNSCPTTNNCDGLIQIIPTIHGESAWQTFPLATPETSDMTDCGDADDAIWFSFVAQSTNDYIVAQDPAMGYDVAIEISDDCDNPSITTCYNNYPAGTVERVIPGGLIPGEAYYYRVYDVATGASSSTDLRTQVKTFEDGGLISSECDRLDFQHTDILHAERDDLGQLYSNLAIPVLGYEFRFVDQDGPLDITISHINLSPYMSLSNVTGLEYGHVYDVSVRHLVKINANGAISNYWSEFGTSCPIGLQASPPTTQLLSLFCPPLQGLYLEDYVQANPVLGASQYRFRFSGGGETLYKYSNNYTVFLHTVGSSQQSGLSYGELYAVDVDVEVNGTWSGYGPACMISMVNNPASTALQSAYCNGTYEYPNNPNYLLAQYIYGAEAYEWRATPVGGGIAQTAITSGISLQMHTTTIDFSFGGQWDIEVRALAGGIWGDFGASCPITLNSTVPELIDNEGLSDRTLEAKIVHRNITLYPNPNDGTEFRVSIDGLSENGMAEMFLRDIQGRLIEAKSYTYNEKSDFIWKTSSTLESGVYLLETRIGNERMTSLFTVR